MHQQRTIWRIRSREGVNDLLRKGGGANVDRVGPLGGRGDAEIENLHTRGFGGCSVRHPCIRSFYPSVLCASLQYTSVFIRDAEGCSCCKNAVSSWQQFRS